LCDTNDCRESYCSQGRMENRCKYLQFQDTQWNTVDVAN
jgi:hypothetical protein